MLICCALLEQLVHERTVEAYDAKLEQKRREFMAVRLLASLLPGPRSGVCLTHPALTLTLFDVMRQLSDKLKESQASVADLTEQLSVGGDVGHLTLTAPTPTPHPPPPTPRSLPPPPQHQPNAKLALFPVSQAYWKPLAAPSVVCTRP